MKALLRCLLSLLLLTSYGCAAQPREEVPLFSQAELDQILAPIALYPDPLLSQVLMAATYPLEVVQAARWSREHPGLQGQEAVRAVDDKAWDPSVKSLVAFPNLLAQMDADLDWTERLGDAFLAQQQQVMDTVQSLRQRAYDAGNLRSGEHVQVVREREVIYVRSAYPDVIYVPYYDPFTIYGSWWWPYYRPVYWAPWPSYGVTLGYGSRGGFYWGSGFSLGAGFFFSDWDWHDHHVRVVDYPPFYYRRAPYVQHVWVHDYHHRRGVPYRHHAVEARYVPEDGRPVRRHDYGDERDSDRDYRYRNDDERDGDRGAYTRQERRPELNREQDRNRDRNGSTPAAGVYRDGNATPDGGGPDRGGRPERDVRSAPVNGAPAGAQRRQEDLARPAPGTNQRSFGKDRETATQRAPSSGPTTIERPTSVRRDTGNRSETMPQQPTYRTSSPPARIREPQGGTTSRPEQIREPRRSEPGMQQRTVAPRPSEAPMQRQATPREVQSYPAPRNVQREMPERAQPEAQPGGRSYPQAAPQHESRSGGGSFVAPDRGNRDPAGGGAMERRGDTGQQRQAEPRGQSFGAESRHGGGDFRTGGGDPGRGGSDPGRGDRGNPRYERP